MGDSGLQVSDRIALQDLLLKYAAGVDERDFDLYASVFDKDVEVEGFGAETVKGRDKWVEYVKGALERFGPTQHMLGPQYASIDGDTAKTRTDVQALHVLKDPEGGVLTLWATYKSDMKKIDGEWKIVKHRLDSRTTRVEPPPEK